MRFILALDADSARTVTIPAKDVWRLEASVR